RGDFVPVLEILGTYLEARVGVPDHQVGIVSRGDTPFALPQPCQPGWRGAHPLGQIGDREAALPRSSPDRGQGELERRDASPGTPEVAGFDLLHLRRAGRVVRRDQIEDAFAESLPELLPVLPRADRRGALVG